MRTLDEVYGRCKVDGKHRIWLGAVSDGVPRVYAPELQRTADRLAAALAAADGSRVERHRTIAALLEAMDPVMASQPGRRAVWQMHTGKPIRPTWRVYGTCDVQYCVAAECTACGSPEKVGRHIADSGIFKNVPKRMRINAALARKRSSLTQALFDEILLSPETGRAIAQRLNLGETLVSKVRTHGPMAFKPAGGLFAALEVRR